MEFEEEQSREQKPYPNAMEDVSVLLSSYLGISFAVFLGLLPHFSLTHVASLQSRNRVLSMKLFQAEDQLHQMRSRRKEDSKANARVVEIFANHRHAWQQEEKSFLHRIDAAADEIAALRVRISEMERSEGELRCSLERLQGEVAERDEMLDLMARREVGTRLEEQEWTGKKESEEDIKEKDEEEEDYCDDYKRTGRFRVSKGMERILEPCFVEDREGLDEMAMYLRDRENALAPGFSPAAVPSKLWTDSPNVELQQDIQFDSHSSAYYGKHQGARREYPWKVSSDAAGVSSKLNLLEQDLSTLEKMDRGTELTAVQVFLRKIWKRYQSLAAKVDDLCRRMQQLSYASKQSPSPEFRTKQQTLFLVEASTFQHRAKEMRQKLDTLHTETTKSHLYDELSAHDKLAMRRLLDSTRSGFKEIQRNLEIWLARIMGDLEGVLARDSNSTVRDYYISRYPFVR